MNGKDNIDPKPSCSHGRRVKSAPKLYGQEIAEYDCVVRIAGGDNVSHLVRQMALEEQENARLSGEAKKRKSSTPSTYAADIAKAKDQMLANLDCGEDNEVQPIANILAPLSTSSTAGSSSADNKVGFDGFIEQDAAESNKEMSVNLDPSEDEGENISIPINNATSPKYPETDDEEPFYGFTEEDIAKAKEGMLVRLDDADDEVKKEEPQPNLLGSIVSVPDIVATDDEEDFIGFSDDYIDNVREELAPFCDIIVEEEMQPIVVPPRVIRERRAPTH